MGKERLFEMMNKVGGMPLNENFLKEDRNLPPGFSSADFESIDDFVDQEVSEEIQMEPTDVNQLIRNKYARTDNKVNRDRSEPYLHNKLINKIVDPSGKEYDLEKLRSEITQRPNQITSTNTKLGKNGIVKISLPAYRGLFYDESDGTFKIVSTCPNAGKCKNFCYAQAGGYVTYDNSSLSSTRILNFLLNRWDEFKYKVIDEIERARIKNEKNGGLTIVRWHDSGDFLSEKYLALAMDIARNTPNTIHYAYTKMVSTAKAADVPPNFTFRFSLDDEAPENELIDKAKDKHADVIPRNVIKSFVNKNKEDVWVYNSPEAASEAKQSVAKHFGLNPNTVITYNELLNIPEEGVNKWNVINLPTDGDISAVRGDVLGVYLMFH